MARHVDATKEWGSLGAQTLIPSAITYKPKINSRTVQGEITEAGARQEGGEADGGTETVGESQGGRGKTLTGVGRLVGQLGQVVVPAELRADINTYGFWKGGTTAMFNIRIVKLNAGSYLRMTPEKALAKGDKEKKDLYLQD